MAALLGAVVGSVSRKPELEKAISVLLCHPGGAARAGASCTAQSDLRAVPRLLCSFPWHLPGGSWNTNLIKCSLPSAGRVDWNQVPQERLRLELQLERSQWSKAWLCCFGWDSISLGYSNVTSKKLTSDLKLLIDTSGTGIKRFTDVNMTLFSEPPGKALPKSRTGLQTGQAPTGKCWHNVKLCLLVLFALKSLSFLILSGHNCRGLESF